MNKQLIKDFGRLLNDGRLGFCDVRSDKTINGELGDGRGVIIGHVVWSHGNACRTIAYDLHVTPDTLIDALITVYANHPTRVLSDVMYSIKYDTKRNSVTLGVTNSSNLELFNVKHTRISAQLRGALEYAQDKLDVSYCNEYCDKFVSNFDKAGGYCFTFK